MKNTIGFLGICFLLNGCSSEPPKPTTPSLTPEVANQLLQYDARAETWKTHFKKQNPGCDYELLIPDQASHPSELDFKHIVQCQGRPAPLEFDASVSFEYNKDNQHWELTRFSD